MYVYMRLDGEGQEKQQNKEQFVREMAKAAGDGGPEGTGGREQNFTEPLGEEREFLIGNYNAQRKPALEQSFRWIGARSPASQQARSQKSHQLPSKSHNEKVQQESDTDENRTTIVPFF